MGSIAYQVLWLGNEDCRVSWEKEDAIPKSVLKEFEEDVLVEVQKLSTEKMGQTSHILSVSIDEQVMVPTEEGQKGK